MQEQLVPFCIQCQEEVAHVEDHIGTYPDHLFIEVSKYTQDSVTSIDSPVIASMEAISKGRLLQVETTSITGLVSNSSVSSVITPAVDDGSELCSIDITPERADSVIKLNFTLEASYNHDINTGTESTFVCMVFRDNVCVEQVVAQSEHLNDSIQVPVRVADLHGVDGQEITYSIRAGVYSPEVSAPFTWAVNASTFDGVPELIASASVTLEEIVTGEI